MFSVYLFSLPFFINFPSLFACSRFDTIFIFISFCVRFIYNLFIILLCLARIALLRLRLKFSSILNHNHSFVVHVTSLRCTQLATHKKFHRNKIAMEILYFIRHFRHQPNQLFCKRHRVLCVYILFDFMLEQTTNCRNKTIQHILKVNQLKGDNTVLVS